MGSCSGDPFAFRATDIQSSISNRAVNIHGGGSLKINDKLRIELARALVVTAALLYVPSKLGYGDADSGPIPPGSTLVFRIELLGVLQHGDTAQG